MSEAKKVALLDGSGLLLGYAPEAGHFGEEVGGRVIEAEVEVEAECDLAAGRYVYDHRAQTFAPIMAEDLATRLLAQPNTLRAIALGFESLRAAGVKLHPDTVAWLDFWKKSVDAQGAKF